MWAAVIFTSCVVSSMAKPPSPHIVFILADDLGWNDVGYNNPDIISPNIDSLARSGIILNQSYMQPVCSPSRAAFMTGVYPFKLGMQHAVILTSQAACVPLGVKLLPQVLRTNGYATHLVGKWHLGFCKWECTPTYRGFDTFYGFHSGSVDYYTKVYDGGYDFWNNTEVDKGAAGGYDADQFTKRVEETIHQHDPEVPLFTVLAYANIHAPLQVPQEYIDLYPNISDHSRKLASAMVTNMDSGIGRVLEALKRRGMYEDAVLVFTSDNGGRTTYGGNNYPLRGGKATIFEGGTRCPAFVHSPLLKNKGAVYEGMIHVVDWFPTLTSLAGIHFDDPNQDGLDLWESISSLQASKRNEFVYNLDLYPEVFEGQVAIRIGDFKLIRGYPGKYNGWYIPDDPDQGSNMTVEFTGDSDLDYLSELISQVVNDTASVAYLFNLRDDPEERNNVYDQFPEVVQRLQTRLDFYRTLYVQPNFPDLNPNDSYINNDGVWAPGWC